MADMLKISTFAAQKSYSAPNKPIAQTDAVFNVVDLGKVLKTNDQKSESRNLNNSDANKSFFNGNSIEVAKNPLFQGNLLKGLLSSDFAKQLLSNASPDIVNEFNEFANNIFLNEGNIVADIIAQQKGSTRFAGEIFDMLRNLVSNTDNPDLKNAVTSFLKSAFSLQSSEGLLSSISANFNFLAKALEQSPSLSNRLFALANQLSSGDNSAEALIALKKSAIELLDIASTSLIATDKIKNMISLTKHNISLFNDNTREFTNAFKTLSELLSDDVSKEKLSAAFSKFIQGNSIPASAKKALTLMDEAFANANKIVFGLTDVSKNFVTNANSGDITKLLDAITKNLLGELPVAPENTTSKIDASLLEKALLNGDTEALESLVANASTEVEGPSGNVSFAHGLRTLEQVLKALLPQDSGNLALDFVKNFAETKDLNSLMDRLNYLLNNLPDGDVKTQAGEILNRLLNSFADSHLVSYKPPTSMESLTNFLAKTLTNQNINLLGMVEPHALIDSMLTAPGVFTPLIHFVLPLQYEDMRSFAEVWVDNPTIEDGAPNENDENHIFMTFDIEDVGLFELEMFTRNRDIDIGLFCPEKFVSSFKDIKPAVNKIASSAGYQARSMNVAPLKKVRDLTDVFPRLNERRAGLDAKA